MSRNYEEGSGPTRFCKDCRFCLKSGNRYAEQILSECLKAKVVATNFVTGEYKIYLKCVAMRRDEERCGFSARWFKPIKK